MKPIILPFQEEQVNETRDLEVNPPCNYHHHDQVSISEDSVQIEEVSPGQCHPPPNESERGEETSSNPSRFTCTWFKNTFLSLPNCFGLFFDSRSHVPRTRIYQVWPGKNVFFFRGRTICGPDPRGLIVTAIAIILTDWIFCAYINDTGHSILTAAISILLTTIVMINLFLTSTRDPGIVPRNEILKLEQNNGSRCTSVSIAGEMVKLKYCKICKIYRPPRSCHCVVCDNCVEKFDHHCPWISQCIGLRNYRYYLMFISSSLVFFVYIFAFSWWRIRRDWVKTHKGFFQLLEDAPETFLLALFSFMAIWFLGGIIIFHAYLISLNQTASENFKQRYGKNPNPYDKGMLRNIQEAFFTRLPPSKVNFRAVVEPDWHSIARVFARREDGLANAV
ncbi:hypothetical protein Cni_G21772 [Canna indica]|uniref:S-acyltransferase n=1 Tax=Canna indica TaxID=4628 RepID=A0AAQ3QKL8_9LILI|nr:hypothetical protein Cni_G21772 [Canna indica]